MLWSWLSAQYWRYHAAERAQPPSVHAARRHLHDDGTASTIASLVEAMAWRWPDNASIPRLFLGAARWRTSTGRRILRSVEGRRGAARTISRSALENAIVTNGSPPLGSLRRLHPLLLAGRLVVPLSLAD